MARAKIYVLDEDVTIKTKIKGRNVMVDGGVLYANGNLTIYKGYSWDGATPRFKTNIEFLNKISWTFGIWNGFDRAHYVTGHPRLRSQLYYATLVHDFINNELSTHVSYHEWNWEMVRGMWKAKFILLPVYAFAIYAFGWPWWIKSRKKYTGPQQLNG